MAVFYSYSSSDTVWRDRLATYLAPLKRQKRILEGYVERERALVRLKRGEAKFVPVLVKPCLWRESVFSEIQILPRGASRHLASQVR
jgi:hypothetical protein